MNEDQVMDELDENIPSDEGDQELIEEAMAAGWRPKDEYTGDPKKWVSAEVFVQRGREIAPILRKQNEGLRAEMKEMKDRLKKTEEEAKALTDYNAKIEARAYERAMKDLKAQRRAAIAAQDEAALETIEGEIESLEEIKPAPVEAKKEPETPKAPVEDPIFKEWATENKSWFNDKNPDLLDSANGIGMRLRTEKPELVGRPFLDELKRVLVKRYPDKFAGSRTRPGMVEGDTGSGGEGRRTGALSDLPAEARRECAGLIKEDWYIKLAKSKGQTPTEMFVSDYRDNE